MIKNKKIILKKKTKIYILAPANTFTGGPECLHQLAFYVSKIFKVKTLMFYLPNESKRKCPSSVTCIFILVSLYLGNKVSLIL